MASESLAGKSLAGPASLAEGSVCEETRIVATAPRPHSAAVYSRTVHRPTNHLISSAPHGLESLLAHLQSIIGGPLAGRAI